MATTFYAGQTDYIDKLNTLATANDLTSITAAVAAAAASATAAAGSASTASTQASNAAASATAAAGSASTASTQASTASTQASNAAASATAAAGSASTASTQASNAAASATAAAGSASTASTQASNAAASATAAAGSASTASTQASNAAASATAAAGYLAPVTATSTTSTTIALGSISQTVQTGKAFVPGHPIKIVRTSAPSTTYMTGNVTSYNSGTGAIVCNITAILGSGTFTDWTLSLTVSSDGSIINLNVSGTTTLSTEAVAITTNNLPVIRPSLNLNFSNSQAVDPRITFTRASTATRTNAKGLLESVASGTPRIDFDPVTLACKGLLIEEARTNLLTYSEQFDNAAWGKTRSSVTANATAAPDGTVTADKLVEAVGTATDYYLAQGTTVVSGTAYTFAVYAKAAERSQVTLWLPAAGFGTIAAAIFTLSGNGTAAQETGSSTNSIAALGNGWYRCAITSTATTSVGTAFLIRTALAGTSFYNGDGTSGLYLWGAQLEAGAFPTSYQPSTETWTGRASTATYFNSSGLIALQSSGVARMSYNPMNLTVAPKLMLEAAATNLLLRSEEFDNASWTKTNATVTANAVTAPDGTATADKLVENSATNYHFVSQFVTPAAGAISYSIYAKAAENSVLAIDVYSATDGTATACFNVATGVAGTVIDAFVGSVSTSILSCGNGWYRCSISATPTAVSTRFGVFLADGSSETLSYAGDGTSGLYIWGAQLEAGSYPTSYIPTTTAQVTRVADTSTSAQTTRAADVASMTGANFSSWYRQDEGAFVCDWAQALTTSTADSFGLYRVTGTGGANPAIAVRIGYATFRRIRSYAQDAGGVFEYAVDGSAEAGNSGRHALAYGLTNDFAGSSGGASVIADTTGGITDFACNTLQIGLLGTQLNGHISRIAYYPKRLTNAELQALSTQ